jgi:lipopolysaccharide export system permease protein
VLIKTYTKYIIQQVNSYFFAVLFVLIAMVWLTQSLRLIDLITSKGIDLFSFLKITTMLITPLSYIIIPIALLIAVISLISKFSHDRELVVLRNAGLSNYQIAKPIIIYAAIITIFNYAVSLYLMPKSYREFKDMQEMFKNKYLSLFLEEGVFNTQINNLTVYIDQKEDDANFKGIFIYDSRNSQKPKTIMADSGSVTRTNLGPEFLLQNGSQQEESKQTGQVSLVFFDSYRFNLSLFSDVSMIRSYDANELFIHQLLAAEDASESIRQEFLVHANQRIVWPFYTMVMSLLSMGLMLSGYYSRRTHMMKNIITSLVAAGGIILSFIFNNMAMRNSYLIPLMYINCLVFFVIGVALLREHHQLKFLVNLELMFYHKLNIRKLLKRS